MISETIINHIEILIDEDPELDMTVSELIQHVRTTSYIDFGVRTVIKKLHVKSILFNTDALAGFFEVKPNRIHTIVNNYYQSLYSRRNRHRA